jgi:hypothetical protein
MSDDDARRLTRQQRARIASQAQAAANKALRDSAPESYQEAYQREKDRLTREALEAVAQDPSPGVI